MHSQFVNSAYIFIFLCYNRGNLSLGGINVLKYNEIATEIEQDILQRNLKQGTKLPKFEELIARYKVSKSTIVKALAILESRGVIYQVQGSGVFVRRRKKYGYINMLENQGFTSDLEEFKITTKVLGVEKIFPTEEIAEYLNCAPGDSLFHVQRIRYINAQALCIEESFFKSSIVPYLNEEIANESIFNYLKSALKLKIGFSDKYLHVIKMKEAESKLLEIETGSPGLFVEELFYLNSGEPFDFSKTTYHHEHSQFFLQSSNLK